MQVMKLSLSVQHTEATVVRSLSILEETVLVKVVVVFATPLELPPKKQNKKRDG